MTAETDEIVDLYTRRGLRILVPTIENRALRPGANLYLVTTPEGKAIGGNVGALAPGVMASTGWSETGYRRLDEQDTADHRALVRVTELTNGFRLLVGRDLEERRRLFGIVAHAAQWSLLVVFVLGIGGGIFVARRVLRRIDAMSPGTTQRIMAGDLSGRLPVGRSGDELDRLAENLNAMLERIEALMTGLKEVSRQYRPRPEDAADAPAQSRRGGAGEFRQRGGVSRSAGTYHRGIRRPDPHLQRAVDDRACRVRPGAGQHRRYNARDIARSIHELYEPLAEDDGMTLRVKAAPATLHGNRELIGQALANLVENAIKYGKPSPVVQPLDPAAAARVREILIEARREGDTVLLSVTDHGPGIPESDRRRAWSVSCRSKRAGALRVPPSPQPGVQRSRRCHGGTGGSLAICIRVDRDAGDTRPSPPGSDRLQLLERRDGQAEDRHEFLRIRRADSSARGISALPAMPNSALRRMAAPNSSPSSAVAIGAWLDRPFAHRPFLLGVVEFSPYLVDLFIVVIPRGWLEYVDPNSVSAALIERPSGRRARPLARPNVVQFCFQPSEVRSRTVDRAVRHQPPSCSAVMRVTAALTRPCDRFRADGTALPVAPGGAAGPDDGSQ